MGILWSTVLWGQQESWFSPKGINKRADSEKEVSINAVHFLKKKGITFGATGSLESYYNFMGGIKTGWAFAALLDANMNVNLEKLLKIKNGTFYVDFEYHGGDNPTGTLTGDLQIFDKNNAVPFFEVYEIWYQQILFYNQLRIKLGKVDANTEFSVIDNGLNFMNSATQVSPAFPVVPTYPNPMPGIALFYTPGSLFYADFALYDANQHENLLVFSGNLSYDQLSKYGQLFLLETGLKWKHFPVLGHKGNLKLGLWKHNGEFISFYGSSINGLSGIYAIYDQTLWKSSFPEKGLRSLRVFIVYGLTDSRISAIFRHWGGGIVLSAPFNKRKEDEVGFSIQNADISSALRVPKKNELNFETYYQYTLSPQITLKPDVQYIVHPGGQYHNALIATFVFNFSFQN